MESHTLSPRRQLYDKGLAYQGYRVLPYCPKDQTPLSAHELRMDADVYQDRQDTTVSVAVKMRDEDDAYAVFWTTTPWTVPTNFAIVVGADIDYVEVRPTEGKFAGKKFYLGAGSPRQAAAWLLREGTWRELRDRA